MQKIKILISLAILVSTLSYAQTNSELWKIQFAVGVNNPKETTDNGAIIHNMLIFQRLTLGCSICFLEA